MRLRYWQALLAARPLPLRQILLWILGAGCGLRLAGLAAGLGRLALYRRAVRPFDPPPAVRALSRRLGARASLRLSDQVAVCAHELLHVRRRDWLFTVLEEFVRARRWFHPAVWWILSQIQLAREKAVDRLAAAETGSRDRYLEALLEAAGGRVEPDLAPAP